MTTIGTYTPPIPIELPEATRAQRVRRSAQTAASFAWHLGRPVARRVVLRRPTSGTDIARRLRRVFDDLGSTYTKFGQVIASSPGAFGADVADEFRSLLDSGAAVPFARVQEIVEADLGRPMADVFARFDATPIAAASMAVVHRAQLLDGRDVAVKVLRPGMREAVAIDIDLMRPMFRRLGLMGVDFGGLLYRYVAGFRQQVAEELDLRNETRTMQHFRALLAEASLEGAVIPEPIDGLCTQRVLVMEFLDGVPIDDLDAVGELGVDPAPLVQAMLDFWFLTGIRDGVFHGDIHAGNLMLLRDGRLGVIDWGIVGVLDERTRHVFRRFVAGVLGDETAWADVAEFVSEMVPFVPAEETVDRIGGRVRGILTSPFGDVDVGAMVAGRGGARRDDDPAMTAARKGRRKQALKSGVADSDFGRANFLLFKQLLYFDRYGKLYLADRALLGNEAFLKQLLADAEEGA